MLQHGSVDFQTCLFELLRPRTRRHNSSSCLLSLPLFSSPPRCAVYPRVPVEGSRRQRDKLQLVSDLRLQTRSHTPRTEALSKQGPHILSFASRRLDRVLRNADTPAWATSCRGAESNPWTPALHSPDLHSSLRSEFRIQPWALCSDLCSLLSLSHCKPPHGSIHHCTGLLRCAWLLCAKAIVTVAGGS